MNQYRWALVGLALTSLFWAGNALVARYVAGEIPPITLAFYRWAIPFFLLLPFSVRYMRLYHEVIRQNFRQLVILSVLSVTCYNSILYMAAVTTTSINITLVSTMLPAGTILFSILLLRLQPSRLEILGALVSFSGILTILGRGSLGTFASLQFNTGDLVMLTAMLCWALYSVLLRKWVPAIPLFPFLCIQITLGAPVITPFYALEWHVEGGFALTWQNMLVLLYVATLPSIAAYLLWNNGVKAAGPATASIFSYLIPVFTTLLAIPLLGESLKGYHWAGFALAFIGLWLATRGPNPAANSTNSAQSP